MGTAGRRRPGCEGPCARGGPSRRLLQKMVWSGHPIIGVLCQVVLDVSALEKETHVKAQMQKTLLVMLKDLDADNSGHLSKEEMQVARGP